MKIVTGLLMLALWCSVPSMAQLVLTKDASGNAKYSLYVPESKVVDAATFVKKAELGLKIKLPQMVELNLREEFTKTKNMCPLLKAPKPSLELDGERTSNQTVGLEWKAYNGGNNLGFDVERSFDDSLHFERVNFVWAKSIGGIKDKYALPDDNDYNKLSFYRLRLALRTGEYIYSNIAKVGGYTKDALFAYPNPAVSSLTINAIANIDGAASLKIYNATGMVVWQQSSFLNEGTNVKTIPLTNLAAGAYTVRIDMKDNTTRTAKFIKQ